MGIRISRTEREKAGASLNVTLLCILAMTLVTLLLILLGAIPGFSQSPPTYGSNTGADELANTQIGPGQIQGDYRFRATHTGVLASVHTFFICSPGYGAGTGGSYRIELQSDDGTGSHFASGKVLATTNENSPENLFTTETFAAPASTTSGTLYHLVYTNKDSAPSANFCSLDMLWWDHPAPSPGQPFLNLDWSHLYNQGSVSTPKWIWRNDAATPGDGNYFPTLELAYADGTILGNGYMESWINTSRKTISGGNQIRETFTVSGGDKTVSGFTVRLKLDHGTDPLTFALKTGSGTLVDTGSVAASVLTTSGEFGDNWVTYVFPTKTLTNGQAYNIVLSTAATSQYSLFPLRKGVTHNFDAGSFFADGHAQLTTNTGSTWVNFPDESGNSSTEADLQFYFTVTATPPPPPPPPPPAVPSPPTGLKDQVQ